MAISLFLYSRSQNFPVQNPLAKAALKFRFCSRAGCRNKNTGRELNIYGIPLVFWSRVADRSSIQSSARGCAFFSQFFHFFSSRGLGSQRPSCVSSNTEPKKYTQFGQHVARHRRGTGRCPGARRARDTRQPHIWRYARMAGPAAKSLGSLC